MMSRMVRRMQNRKAVKTLPSVLKTSKRKISTSSTRSRKLPSNSNVDIVDYSGLITPCVNTALSRLHIPHDLRRESGFLEFVDSSEVIDMATSCNTDADDPNLVSFLTENRQFDSKGKSSDKNEDNVEVVVVEIDSHANTPSDAEYCLSSDYLNDSENDRNRMSDDYFSFTNGDSEEEMSAEIQEPAKQFVCCRQGDATVIAVAHPSNICFKGSARIRALLGSCEILGYEIEAHDNKSYDVISPRSNSFLTINTLKGGHHDEVKTSVSHDILRESNRNSLLKNMSQLPQGECVVLLCEQLTSPLFDYLENIPNYKDLFKMEDKNIRYAFSALEHSDSICVSTSHQFKNSLDEWSAKIKDGDKPVAMVIGGKGSGKSTLNRMLINSALNVTSSVSFLDCDVGQAEFTPPGLVSLHDITEPILGPPFSHLCDSDQMCFYGEVTPSKGLTRYIKSVDYIHSLYKNRNTKLPLVVNTLGWNEGLGLKIIIDFIHMMKPTIIIQLDCKYQYQNFHPMTTDFITNTSGWLFNTTVSAPKFKHHSLFIMDSEVPTKHKALYKSVGYRELATLSYLNKGLDIGHKLLNMEPYKINFKDLVIHDCQNPGQYSQMLFAFNASLVGLCRTDMTQSYKTAESDLNFLKETPICHCVGLGIVRAIDMKQQLLYLTTPVSRDKLVGVNCLLKGAVPLPNAVLLQQSDEIESTEIPYIGHINKSIGSSVLNVRSKMPRKQYLNHKRNDSNE